jgi:hypothetical protein
MPVEHRITVAAPADTLFAIYADVPNWHTWDPDTQRARLDGPFAEGSRGRLTPTQGNTVPMVLTRVVPGRAFTAESRIPLFCMVFEHELTPLATGATEVVHRVSFSGPLSLLLAPLMTRRLNSGLPVTLARLKALAEGVGAGISSQSGQ